MSSMSANSCEPRMRKRRLNESKYFSRSSSGMRLVFDMSVLQNRTHVEHPRIQCPRRSARRVSRTRDTTEADHVHVRHGELQFEIGVSLGIDPPGDLMSPEIHHGLEGVELLSVDR